MSFRVSSIDCLILIPFIVLDCGFFHTFFFKIASLILTLEFNLFSVLAQLSCRLKTYSLLRIFLMVQVLLYRCVLLLVSLKTRQITCSLFLLFPQVQWNDDALVFKRTESLLIICNLLWECVQLFWKILCLLNDRVRILLSMGHDRLICHSVFIYSDRS